MTDLEPLDDDVLALLGEAKAIPELDAEAKARILTSVDARIGALGGGGGGGRGGGGGSTPSGSLLARGAATLMIFAVGVGTGVALAPLVRPPPPAAAVVTPKEAPPTPPATAKAEPALVMELPTTPAAPIIRPPVSSPPSAPSARGLAAERALLDIARAALARGDANEAMSAVDRHAREYPDGVLVEEREALGVKGLVALGRRDEARRRAERFEEKFPNGLMLRAVKGAVGEPGTAR